jgi:hypothetical protein
MKSSLLHSGGTDVFLSQVPNFPYFSLEAVWLSSRRILAARLSRPGCQFHTRSLLQPLPRSLAGEVVLCVGIIVVATAHSIGAAIGGMAVAGAGAAIGELTALAGLVINLSKFLYHPYC